MKSLLISFLVGLLVGVPYGVIRVKSPAPPIVALVGLLGMVIGEQTGGWLLTKKVQAANVSSPHTVVEREDQQQRRTMQSVLAACAGRTNESQRSPLERGDHENVSHSGCNPRG
jgi:XapX domain-containing protein